MNGVPVTVMAAVWRALGQAGVRMVGIDEHNAVITALSPCFRPDYLDGINGWPLTPPAGLEDDEEET